MGVQVYYILIKKKIYYFIQKEQENNIKRTNQTQANAHPQTLSFFPSLSQTQFPNLFIKSFSDT